MQVNLSTTPTPLPGAASAQDAALVLSILKGLCAFGSPAAVKQQDEQQRLDGQRRDAAERKQALAAASATSPAETIFQAERRLDPSSRAWRHQQARALAQQRQGGPNRPAFRHALANVNNRGEGSKPPPSGAENSGKDDSAAPRETQKPQSAKPDSGPRAETTRPESRSPIGRPAATRPGEPSATRVPPGVVQGQTRAADSAARSANAVRAAASTAKAGNMPAGAKIAASQSAKAASVVRSTAGDSSAQGTTHSPSRTARAVAKPTPNALQAETADREANVERILRTVSSRIGKQRSVVTLLLDPPELGNVRLHMDLRKDALTLRMDTQTHVAHRLLARELDSLRHGLESAGIHLERVEVRPPSPPPEGVGGQAEQQADAGEQWQEESAEPGAEHPDGQGTEARGRQGTEAEWGSIMSAGQGATGGQEGPAAESLVNVLA